MTDREREISDYEWAWSVLCEEFRSLPSDAVQLEPAPDTPPAEPPSNDGADDV